MLVEVSGPPFNAQLLMWGRAHDGHWGLIYWDQRVRVDGAVITLPYSAWVPSERLHKPHWGAPRATPRIVLDPDRVEWGPPVDWPDDGFYMGVWQAGPITAPTGAAVVSGAAWKR
jgi:hypothetical protein